MNIQSAIKSLVACPTANIRIFKNMEYNVDIRAKLQ